MAARSDADSLLPSEVVEAAITRVLEAEHKARDSVARARDEAAAILDGARRATRALHELADRRVHRIHGMFERHLASTVGAIDAEAEALGAAYELSTQDEARIARAVAALAAELCGERR
jgi:vacuolar-type H+-ATPase subunit H